MRRGVRCEERGVEERGAVWGEGCGVRRGVRCEERGAV